ncbi:MAG: FtsQ-type POTRA domain-containing protein [Actinobacteria bacterium]|nr:FtsQ-type POTRA domain-containing protein [Actinomycetota bacterium]
MTATAPPPTRPPEPPARSPHPRIRARRIEIRRGEGRRRLRRLGALGAAVGMLAVAAALVRSPVLDVDHVRVSGARRTSSAVLLDASGIRRGQAMVDIDTGLAVRRIEGLPWVERAKVARRWPGTVSVAVVERTAVAQAAVDGGATILVDRTGRLLERRARPAAGLLTIAGLKAVLGQPAGTTIVAARPALAVVRGLSPAAAGQVSVVWVAGTDVLLVLRDGGVVRLGGSEERAAKLQAVDLLLRTIDRRCLAVADVRVPTAPVLTRRPGCA